MSTRDPNYHPPAKPPVGTPAKPQDHERLRDWARLHGPGSAATGWR